MEKGFNLRLKDFKTTVINDINNSQMPISIISMVLESILLEIKAQEKMVLDKEIADFELSQETSQIED